MGQNIFRLAIALALLMPLGKAHAQSATLIPNEIVTKVTKIIQLSNQYDLEDHLFVEATASFLAKQQEFDRDAKTGRLSNEQERMAREQALAAAKANMEAHAQARLSVRDQMQALRDEIDRIVPSSGEEEVFAGRQEKMEDWLTRFRNNPFLQTHLKPQNSGQYELSPAVRKPDPISVDYRGVEPISPENIFQST